jgi:hypothetical protein
MERCKLIKNFSETSSTELIPAGSGTRKHIKILAFWIELSADADSIVSFRFGSDGEDMFPKSASGLAALNLIGAGNHVVSPEGTNLYLYIDGTLTARGTVVYTHV